VDENEILNQRLAEAPEPPRHGGNNHVSYGDAAPAQPITPPVLEFVSWQAGPNDTFGSTGKVVEKLPAGVFKVEQDHTGRLWLKKHKIILDDVVELPDSASIRALLSIRTFWNRKDKYREHGLIYKRGLLLWGPPGSGKTVTITQMMRELVLSGGIVLLMEHPTLTALMLQQVRAIEPNRPIIVVIEDIDEVIKQYGEHQILALLDGENQIDNVVALASTNYPELLGARIVNRPTRFDERIYVGMPGPKARMAYLKKVWLNAKPEELAGIVADTENLSIAHLRELASAVLCLDVPYGEALKRLRAMTERPKAEEGFARRAMGLAS
jgi:AAA+ superfamily predicted ATPase